MTAMRKDHRPYALKKAWFKFQKFYTRHFIAPQLDALGKGYTFLRPWHVELFGGPIEIGRYATVIAAADGKIRMSVWPAHPGNGRISIGDHVLISPGVRISSAEGIHIHDNCMLAHGVYITDADWHGVYDRVSLGRAAAVTLEENVWVGDSAIICKGARIGRNSIVGAGAIVVNDIEPNSIAAGNPAKVVKRLDPERNIITRSAWFSDPVKLATELSRWDRLVLKDNTLWGWLRHLVFPGAEK